MVVRLIGSRPSDTNFGLSADVTLTNVTYTVHSCGSDGDTPEGGLFAVAQFSIVAVSGQYDLGDLNYHYTAVDGQGDGVESDVNFHPALGGGTFNSGDTAVGYVAFDVTSKGGIIEVSLTQNITDNIGTQARWAAPY